MGASARIARNTTYLTVASIIQKIISFGYFGFLAKALGEAQLGKYAFALSFTSVFIIFMDFGLGPLLTREGAKDESSLEKHFQELFSIKLVLMAVSLIAMLLSIHGAYFVFDQIDTTDITLVYIGGIIILFDTVTFTLFSYFRALKQLFWEALGIILYQSTILAVGLVFIFKGFPLPVVLAALLVGSAAQCLYLFIVFKKVGKVHFRFQWNWKRVRYILGLSAPFALAGIIFRLNGSADSIMLKLISGDSYAGWYGLSFKLLFALTVLPGAFATSYFPAISTYYKSAKEKMHEVFESGMIYMAVLSFPITAGVAVLGDDIILAVWGEAWAASIQALWVLTIALPFIFANYPVGNFLNAADRQRLNTMNMLVALLVNIGLNMLLIPQYTFVGAGIAAVASSIVLVSLGLPWVYIIAPFRVWHILKKITAVAAAALIMAFVLFFIQHTYPLLVLIPLGAALYGILLILLNGMTVDEIRQIKQAVLKQ